MEYNVKVWRQKNAKAKGHFETYHVTDVEEDASFLEMLDILNDQLIRKGWSRSPSTTTAAKVSAEPAPCTSTDVPMDRMIK